MVPLLPESFREFHDSFVPSETAGPIFFSTNAMKETFSVKRLPGSRTIRDLMITSGGGHFKDLHRTFRRLRQKKPLRMNKNLKLRKNCAEGSLHQKPRDVCAIEEVMDAEISLHQKPREVCITEDTQCINTKLNCVKNGTRCLLQVGVHDWESLGTSPSRIQIGFGETVADVMDAEVEGENEIHPSTRPRVAERVGIHVPLFRSSSLATGVLVPICTGTDPVSPGVIK